MALGKGRRKLLWVFGGCAAAIILLLVSLPIWFPWVLRPLAARQGIHYSTYELVSYSRFALEHVQLTNQTSRITASRIESLLPTAWLWRLAADGGHDRVPFARADHWQFEALPGPMAAQEPPTGVDDQVRKLAATLGEVHRWLPNAVLSNGTVQIGKTQVAASSVNWENAELRAMVKLSVSGREAPVAAELRPALPFALRVHSPLLQLDSVMNFTTNANGLDVQCTNYWWSNRIELLAHFNRNGLLPETAALNAREFALPAAVAKIPNYQEIAGSLVGNWKTGSFVFELVARAEPITTQTNLPTLAARMVVQGDTNAATIEAFNINCPALAAKLSNPVTVHFKGPSLEQPVALQVRADLAKQPWLPVTGVLSGAAEFRPGAAGLPEARVRVSGSEIGNGQIKARTFAFDARCDWPLVSVTVARASFEDGSEASLAGKADVKAETIADGVLQFSGPLARQWLPEGCSYESLSVTGRLEGPFKALTHAGRVELTHFTSPEFQPVQLEADWAGKQRNIEHFGFKLSCTNSSLAASGSTVLNSREPVVQLSRLSFDAYNRPLLELKQPCQVTARRRPPNHWDLTVHPFEWQGPGGELRCSAFIDWPSRGDLQLYVRDLSSTNFAGIAKRQMPEAKIRTLQATASWTNGPVAFSVALSTVGRTALAGAQQAQAPTGKSTPEPLPSGRPIWESLLAGPVAADVNMAGDRTGVTLSNLVVKTSGADVVTIDGFVPITFDLSATNNPVNLRPHEPLRLTALVQPEAAVWDEVEDLTGVTLEKAQLKLSLSGSWEELRGQIAFAAARMSMSDAPATMPSIQNVRFQVQLDRDEARLTSGAMQIQGQPVQLTANVPLGQNFWLGLKDKKLPDLQQATARLRIEHAQIAAFESLFPELLAPQGELNASLDLDRGAKLSGTVNIEHARTRPLSDLGPVRDINVNLRCRDRFLELQNATAKIGGAPIVLSGGVDFKGTNWLRGALPPFQISIHGTDVPLSRQPESIIRSDLLLGITKTNSAPPLISGVAHLRDSFFLSDLSALVPGKVASPSARPPYFSIAEPPLADWRLAVTVDGAHFLKVRSPVFQGEVSANLTLQGTLKDPIALGDLKIDSGIVRFPFANLQLQQGLVNLTSQNPYHPQLLVSAISKQFGYDIRMEVSGTADAPIIQFTSNPPLSSEQIVLLITAGQMPQGAYTLTPQQRAQTVALFLGGDLLTKLGFGDQTQQRLTIRSGEQISIQGKPTYNLEYKLTDRWAVIGEYDRFGDYNAGLKWRIYSK